MWWRMKCYQNYRNVRSLQTELSISLLLAHQGIALLVQRRYGEKKTVCIELSAKNDRLTSISAGKVAVRNFPECHQLLILKLKEEMCRNKNTFLLFSWSWLS